jgi:hypothetical protein
MPRFPRLLALLLTLSLLLTACRPQTADRRPQADGGRLTVNGSQPAVSSPTPTPTETATPTETPIPQPSLESLGLFAETQALLNRQGWDIAWDAQNTRYLIRQRAFDEANKTFTSQLTHEIGWIDTEGRLHFTATQYSASENEDGTWKDTSTQSEVVIDLKNLPKNPDLIIKQQLDENGNPISFQEQLKTPGFHLLETKNPAFEKTGILTLTYLDENGITKTLIYNRELNFLQMPEISTDLLHPTPIPIEAVHSLAALQFILLRYGDGQLFSTENIKKFPGWSIFFQLDETTEAKRALIWPRTKALSKIFTRFIGEGDNGKVLFPLPKFVIIDKNGEGFVSIPVEIFNPKNPQNPKDGNEKLILFPALFTGTMTLSQRIEFLKSFPYDENIINELFDRQRLIIIATQPNSNGDDYFTALYQINEGGWNKVGDRRPLDSLLGMEGNDVKKIDYVNHETGGWYAYFPVDIEGFLKDLTKDNPIQEREAYDVPITPSLQKVVLVISP